MPWSHASRGAANRLAPHIARAGWCLQALAAAGAVTARGGHRNKDNLGGIRDPLGFKGKEGPPSIHSTHTRCSKPSWEALQEHSAGSPVYAVKNWENFLTNLPVLTDPTTGTANTKASISWEKVETEKLLPVQPAGRGKTPIQSPQAGASAPPGCHEAQAFV